MQLTPEQKTAVSSWVAAGDNLSAVQKKLTEQFKLSLTYRDVRYIMAADYNDVDTIEYAYLQGLETPAMDQQVAFDRLGMRHRIYQAFAVKAIDYRGLQQQQGS